VLGDNLFYDQIFSPLLDRAAQNTKGAPIFGYQVKDPVRFGVVEFDDKRKRSLLKRNP